MLFSGRHPLVSRVIPFVTYWVWPVLVFFWGLALTVVPVATSGMFGWTEAWFVDGLGTLVMLASLGVLLTPSEHQIFARIVFLVIPGFSFLGRMSTFITDGGLLTSTGWQSRAIGWASYSLITMGHVTITALAVIIASNRRDRASI